MNSAPHPPRVILAPRITDDSVSMWRTCLELGWKPTRLAGWRVPDELLAEAQDEAGIVIYGEPLFAEAVADQLGLVLLGTGDRLADDRPARIPEP